ncbi:flagellar hook-associated protein FlgK [Aquabacterium sp.]|uniref:flagellar hook-associated protein FlgK n=1 Tax=Aquabacterium sp. TaxID=1872578 RepID=UPI0035B3CF1F
MSAGGLFSISTGALAANYAALNTIGNNISNANTPGYSRQQVQLATETGQYTGAGFFGRGVKITTVSRASDDFLTKEASLTTSQSSMDTARLDQLKQLEKLFPTGDQSIGQAAQNMLNAFADVSTNPQDAAARQVVLSRASQLAAQMRASGEQMTAMQQGIVSDVRVSVDAVNKLAAQVANLNQQIAGFNGTGHSPNDLLDQRDQAINEISKYIQVTTIPAPDGTMGLFIGGTQRLVLGSQAQQLSVTNDTYDASKARISIQDFSGARELDSGTLAGGSIAGMLQFQDQDLTDARNMLGQIAAAMSSRVNEQQSYGLDLGNPPSAGAPIFSVGGPRVLPASTNGKTAGNFTATVGISVTDATKLQASEYELRADPNNAGLYLVTPMSGGQASGTPISYDPAASPAQVIDGFTLNIGSPAPSATDRFLIQPVSQAAQSMQRVLNDPKGIAAASPVTGTVAATNTGTATLASLTVVSSTLNPTLTAKINFTSSSGNYSWTLTDPSNTVVSSGTGTWQPSQPISLNGFDLKLDGVPANGDSVTVAPTTYPASNNGNARAMLALRDDTMVGQSATSAGFTVTAAYAQDMADIGVRVQGAQSTSDISTSIAKSAKDALSNETGVNLDEEAARLIQYQQSYQAAAKVLQVAQGVFDTLLSITGR